MKRTIVCLCGSTRFKDTFAHVHRTEALAGHVVLTVGVYGHHEGMCLPENWPVVKRALDALHRDQIAMADEIIVLNVNGYIGEGLRDEILYARSLNKRIRWLEEPPPEFA